MNTPRTDAACGWPWGHHGRIECGDLKWSPDGPFVHSSVARQLERENATLRDELNAQAMVNGKGGEREAKLLGENAVLRNEIARLNGQTNWVCKCGGTDCAGQTENAALRAALEQQANYQRDLRADRDRLDWLITKGPVEVLVTLSSDPVVARANIDKEMEFPTV